MSPVYYIASGLIAVQIAAVMITDPERQLFRGKPYEGHYFVSVLFSAVSTRTAGFAVHPLDSLCPRGRKTVLGGEKPQDSEN